MHSTTGSDPSSFTELPTTQLIEHLFLHSRHRSVARHNRHVLRDSARARRQVFVCKAMIALLATGLPLGVLYLLRVATTG